VPSITTVTPTAPAYTVATTIIRLAAPLYQLIKELKTGTQKRRMFNLGYVA
jgi:hypothetical protein